MGDDRRKRNHKLSKKDNNSFLEDLKIEWNLFWKNIIGDEVEESSKDPFEDGRLESLTVDQVRAITKALSSDRKLLNQKLESLNKEINLNTTKLESLKLVGGDYQDTFERLNQLSDFGQSLSQQLIQVDERLKLARTRENLLLKNKR